MKLKIVKKNIEMCVIIAVINLFIWCSYYDVWVKIVLTILSILTLLSIYLKPIWYKPVLLTVVAAMVAVNIFYMHQVYYPYILTLGGAYNSSVGWLTTQTSFTWGTGNSDAILPTLLEGRHIYIAEEDPYVQYAAYFSESIELIEGISDCDYGNWQNEFLRIGGMDAAALDWLFHEDIIADMREKGFRPVLYVSSSRITNEKDLFIVSDDDYNLFIMTLKEYKDLK